MTFWPRCEERVRLGCERFLEACIRNGFEGEVDRRLAADWAAGMRDWLEVMGEDWSRLDKAVDEMRQQNPPLIIGSPRSCIKIARNLKHWRAEPVDRGMPAEVIRD